MVNSVDTTRRTVDVVWTTGAKVLRSSWLDGPFYEELSLDPSAVRMGRLNNGAPFLADHDGSSVAKTLGVVESARLEGGKGIATVRFAKAEDDPVADQIFRKIADGIIQNVSVGYRTYKLEKVSGGSTELPTFRATDWEPHELSAVAIGADDGAGFRSAVSTNTCEVLTSGEPRTEQRAMDAEELKKLEEAKRAAELKTATEAAATAERERAAGILSAVRAAKLDATLSDKLIADGVSLDQARATVLDELVKRDAATPTENHVRVTAVAGGDQRDKFVAGVSAAVFEKAGKGLVSLAKQRGVADFVNLDLDGGEYRGMSLQDICVLICKRAGVSLRGIHDRKHIVDLAMRASTGDFSVLFENILRKTMRAAYATQEDTWRRWVGVDTVSDFKTSSRYLNGSFGTLPVVGEGEEFRNIVVPDGSKVEISTETRGGIISISRQAMYNDDMGSLLDVAARFGRGANRSIEAAAYALLAQNSGLGPTMDDSQPFFHSNRSNVNGTSSTLTVAGLDADRVKMRAQMDPDENDYLDLSPSILLVPVGLESAAKVLNASATDPTSAGDLKPNAIAGMFSDIVASPRLTASTTRRYMFTAAKEAFKAVFLEGSGEGPTLESQEGFRVDATEWKARLDFKIVPYDPKTAVTNAGT